MGNWVSNFRPFGHKGKEQSVDKPNRDHCKDSSWWPGNKEKSHLVPTVTDKDFEPVAPPSTNFVDLLQDLPLDKKLPDNIREAVAKDLDFYNKRKQLPKLVDFTKVFGTKNSFDKDDAELKKLATQEDDIMKDLEDWMKSKQNMHAMRSKAMGIFTYLILKRFREELWWLGHKLRPMFRQDEWYCKRHRE